MQVSVNPKVISTPMVTAVAKDGIQVKATSRVTVRANIERLVGGAGEETIIARVGEGIVTTIGSADTHKAVLENPDMISKTVLDKGLDVLRGLGGKGKESLLRAISTTASHDGRLSVREAELIRAVCASLDYPLPPILVHK